MSGKYIYGVVYVLLLSAAALASWFRVTNVTTAQTAKPTITNQANVEKPVPAKTPQFSDEEITARIERLRQIVPDKPIVLSDANKEKEVNKILREAAETKSPLALPLLIRCLGYNHDPDGYKLLAGQANFILSIPTLRVYYGESAGEALFREGIATDKEWLPERIALAVKTNLSAETQTRLKEQFKDDLSATLGGVVFLQTLENEHLLVKLACLGGLRQKQIFCTLDNKGNLKELYDQKNQ